MRVCRSSCTWGMGMTIDLLFFRWRASSAHGDGVRHSITRAYKCVCVGGACVSLVCACVYVLRACDSSLHCARGGFTRGRSRVDISTGTGTET